MEDLTLILESFAKYVETDTKLWEQLREDLLDILRDKIDRESTNMGDNGEIHDEVYKGEKVDAMLVEIENVS